MRINPSGNAANICAGGKPSNIFDRPFGGSSKSRASSIDVATHLLCSPAVFAAVFRGIAVVGFDVRIWRQTNPGMGYRNQDNIAINPSTMAKSRLDGLVEGDRQRMIPCR
jgi:hypothetical protein